AGRAHVTEPGDSFVCLRGQIRDQLRCLLPPGHAQALTGPQGEELGLPRLRSGGPKRPRQCVLQREGKNRLRMRIDLAHEPVHDSACRRSEEHTSELQSPYEIVCRLLLEKKNRPSLRCLQPDTKCILIAIASNSHRQPNAQRSAILATTRRRGPIQLSLPDLLFTMYSDPF